MITEIYEFRNYNIYIISKSLFRYYKMDPEIAMICAWHIYHSNNPKNWSKLMSRISTEWQKIKYYPRIDLRFVRHIKSLYSKYWFYGKEISLLPFK